MSSPCRIDLDLNLNGNQVHNGALPNSIFHFQLVAIYPSPIRAILIAVMLEEPSAKLDKTIVECRHPIQTLPGILRRSSETVGAPETISSSETLGSSETAPSHEVHDSAHGVRPNGRMGPLSSTPEHEASYQRQHRHRTYERASNDPRFGFSRQAIWVWSCICLQITRKFNPLPPC